MNVAIRPNTYISLFSGAGGLELAVRLAASATQCVCYVEREIEAAGILAARFADKALDDAPVWSDVSTFDGKPWRGIVDGIVGGFPCQDLSVAGKRAGIQRGNRSGLFYEYARIIREVEPRWVYIENVPAVLAFPAGGIVLGELAAMGFDAEWGTLRASDVGASHRRKRCFVLAYRCGTGRQQIFGSSLSNEGPHERRKEDSRHIPSGIREGLVANSTDGRWDEVRSEPEGIEGRSDAGQPCIEVVASRDGAWRPQCSGNVGELRDGIIDSGETVEDSGCDAVRRCTGCTEEIGRRPRAEVAGSGTELGNTDDSGLEGRRQLTGERGDERLAGAAGSGMVFAPGPANPIWNSVLVRDYGMRPALSQEEAESCVRRVADGLASPLDQRIDRLRACGNGVVPLQGAVAFRELMRRIG